MDCVWEATSKAKVCLDSKENLFFYKTTFKTRKCEGKT